MIDMHGIDREMRLGFMIHDVSPLRRSAFVRRLKRLNATRSQWWVLACLALEDRMTRSQLAQELDLGKVAAGGAVDRFAKSRRLQREADATGQRVNRAFLEPKRKSLIARMRTVNRRLTSRSSADWPTRISRRPRPRSTR